MTPEGAGDSKRPFGFMRIRYYESGTQVPEMVLNPEDIAKCYTAEILYEHRPGIFIKLKDGMELRLWVYNEQLKDIIADIDTAMLERLQLKTKEEK